jgi:hypothetical protein
MNSASNKSMWFAIPLFFFYIITAMAQNLPFLVTVVCSGVMALITKLAVGKWWPGQSIRNPFWFGSFVAAYSLSAIYYFTTILPSCVANEFAFVPQLVAKLFWFDPDSLNQLALHIVFLTSNFGLLGLYTYLFKSDPGWLVDKKNPVDDETFLTEAVSGRQVTLCPSCMVQIFYSTKLCVDRLTATRFVCFVQTQKCLRSKHCRSCDKCVAKMDHHCYWINNCVGSNNHREFMGLLMLMCIMHLLFLVMCCRRAWLINTVFIVWLPFLPTHNYVLFGDRFTHSTGWPGNVDIWFALFLAKRPLRCSLHHLARRIGQLASSNGVPAI